LLVDVLVARCAQDFPARSALASAGSALDVYSFIPHERTAKLPTEGSLNVDMMDFFRLLEGRPYFSKEMYLDVVEAGFEIVRGKGWVTCGWFSCDAD